MSNHEEHHPYEADHLSPPPPLPAALQAHEPTAKDIAEALALLGLDRGSSPSPPPSPARAKTQQGSRGKERVSETTPGTCEGERGHSRGPGRSSTSSSRDRGSEGGGGAPRRRFTPNTADQPCVYFQSGNCRFGDKCRFSHGPVRGPRSGQEEKPVVAEKAPADVLAPPPGKGDREGPASVPKDCAYWVGTGNCRWGDLCFFQHLEEKRGTEPGAEISLRKSSGPPRSSQRAKGEGRSERRGKGTAVCKFWKAGEACAYGNDCHFRHAAPSSSHSSLHPHPSSSSRRAQVPPPPPPQSNIPYSLSPADPTQRWMTEEVIDDSFDPISGFELTMEELIGMVGQDMSMLEEEEEEEEGGIMGFSADEVMELLSQGVKPWDDDAQDVLNALSATYDGYEVYEQY